MLHAWSKSLSFLPGRRGQPLGPACRKLRRCNGAADPDDAKAEKLL